MFRVLLPASVQAQPHVSASSRTARPGTWPKRVLVIDDDPEVREALARIIGPPHVIVRVAETGQAARELLVSEEDYDVIFCDVMMPDVTGIDLYEAVKVQRPELVARMIFMSAGAFTPRAAEFFERVSARRIDKPFDPVRVRSFLEG